MINSKFYNNLCEDEKNIRTEVFIKEQGFVNEFDDIDDRAIHCVIYKDEKAMAVGRIFKGEKEGEYIIGRVAVLKEYRKLHLGSEVIKSLENKSLEMGCKVIKLSAQCRAKEFYKKLGYIEASEVYYDESCPHVDMIKKMQ